MVGTISIPVIIAVVAGVLIALSLARRAAGSGRAGGAETIVRCRAGHLFTTIWLPLASLKAVRLGPWRYQYCPVGKHWALVRPVDEAELSAEERRQALATRDIRLP